MEWSGCSIPECDHERVKGKFPNWSDDVKKECLNNNRSVEIVKSEGCYPQCASKEEDRLSVIRFQLKVNINDNMKNSRIFRYNFKRLKYFLFQPRCLTTPWSPFSACDTKTCHRIRNRTLLKDGDKQNPSCLKLIFEQKIKCDPCFTDTQKQSKYILDYMTINFGKY